MSRSRFECLRCGKCCTNLHTTIKPQQGLMLYPEERSLFNKKYVIPSWGFGKNPRKNNFQIALYQMTEKICPHYSDSGCLIYNTRPVKCKAYPLDVLKLPNSKKVLMQIAPECSWSQKMHEQYPNRPPNNAFSQYSLEFKEAMVMNEYSRLLFLETKRTQSWDYDVVKRKWAKTRVTDNISKILSLVSLLTRDKIIKK